MTYLGQATQEQQPAQREPLARCSCGRAYDAASWAALKLVGHQQDEVERLELRNCTCGSTIAIPLAMPDRDDYTKLKRVHISTLKAARRSAAHYRHAVQCPPEDKSHFAVGRATHLATTQPELFDAEVVMWPAELGRRYGKRWDSFEAEHASKTILTEAEHAACLAMAHSVRSTPLALDYITGGQAEASMLWTDAETGIECKGLVDYVTPRAIVDLKTTKDASIEGFGREVWRYGYHLQAAFYVDGWSESHEGVQLPFVIIAVEKEPPYVCTVFRLPEDVMGRGREEIRELLALVKSCREQKRWPGYAEGLVDIVLPRWTLPREDNLEGLGIDFGALEAEGKETSP